MSNDFTVSKQWATRPNDQRFLTVDALYEKVAGRRKECRVENVALDAMRLITTPDGNGLGLTDGHGTEGMLNHWSFGQLCARAKAPAAYLRSLPAELAAIPLQWSMEKHEAATDEGNDAKIMIRKNGETWVSAITSPTYGRIWDVDVVRAIRDNVDTNVWKVPGATYAGADPLRATTLYASDRDVFMFLVNEENTIDVEGESLKRGFYVWNSEVGSATFGIATFTYDRVCDNRIIWGQNNFKELTIRHTAGGPHRFVAQAVPQLAAYLDSDTKQATATIRAAKAKEVGNDRESVLSWMRNRGFTMPVARKAYDAAQADPRGYNPHTVWGLVQGVTDVAHEVAHTDERTTLEAKAGKLLDDIADTIPAKELRPVY
jgi:hypothetical protein